MKGGRKCRGGNFRVITHHRMIPGGRWQSLNEIFFAGFALNEIFLCNWSWCVILGNWKFWSLHFETFGHQQIFDFPRCYTCDQEIIWATEIFFTFHQIFLCHGQSLIRIVLKFSRMPTSQKDFSWVFIFVQTVSVQNF